MRKSSTKRWRPLLRHRLSHLTHLRLLLRSPLATSTKPSTLAPEDQVRISALKMWRDSPCGQAAGAKPQAAPHAAGMVAVTCLLGSRSHLRWSGSTRPPQWVPTEHHQTEWAPTGQEEQAGEQGVHQRLAGQFQRCFCTRDKPWFESPIFFCFCFDCITGQSLRPVSCSMPTMLQIRVALVSWVLPTRQQPESWACQPLASSSCHICQVSEKERQVVLNDQQEISGYYSPHASLTTLELCPQQRICSQSYFDLLTGSFRNSPHHYWQPW